MERRARDLERQARDAADTVMSLNLEDMDIEGLQQRAALLANLSQLRSSVGPTDEEQQLRGCGTFSCGSYGGAAR